MVVVSPWTPSPPIRHPELVSGSRFFLYVTLNLFQGPFFEMLNQVQHDEVVVASPWTPPIHHPEHQRSASPRTTPLRHPELVSGSRFWDAESSSAWRGRSGASLVFSAPKPSLFFLFFHDSHKFEHQNYETASLRSQWQVRGCHCEPRFFVWWSSLVFSPKRCHCEVVFSFPKQSLFFSLVPESYFENTPWERRKPK